MDMDDLTSAPRPLAKDVYNRLDDFFSKHVLETSVSSESGTVSSAATEYPTSSAPGNTAESQVIDQKSIRTVAEEHNDWIEATKGPSSSLLWSLFESERKIS